MLSPRLNPLASLGGGGAGIRNQVSKYQTTLDTYSPIPSKYDLNARVGSIKIKQTNFPKNESFFFPEEQVPQHILEKSKQVKR
jgi:hypothetical protein